MTEQQQVTNLTYRKETGSAWRLWYDKYEERMLGILGFICFFALWEIAARSGIVDIRFASSPINIIKASVEYVSSTRFFTDLRVSGIEFSLGLGLSIAIGIPIGLLMGWYRRINAFLDPLVSLAYATPRVALMPLFIIWFGIGLESKVALIFLMAVFPILINTMIGVKTIDADLIRVARSFDASDRQIFSSIILPGSVPAIISGIRLGIGLALIGIVVGELVAATAGIGYLIAEAGSTFQTDLVFVGIIIIASLGVFLTLVLKAIESKFDKWRP